MTEEKKKTTKTAAKKPVKKTPNKTVKKTTPKKPVPKVVSGPYIPALKQEYRNRIVPNMMERFKYHSVMEVPRLQKITLNMGIGDAKNNPKALESAVNELTVITGQKAVVTKATRDVSNFKIRRGFNVGCSVTMRGNRMYEFFQRLITVALPRTRDFTGLSFKSFDRRGNYNFGIKEQLIFTEIDYDKIDHIHGLDVAITTTAKTDEEGYWLLKEFGFPLRDKPVKKEELVEVA